MGKNKPCIAKLQVNSSWYVFILSRQTQPFEEPFTWSLHYTSY